MSYDQTTVKKRPFLASVGLNALAMIGISNPRLPAAPADMQPMLAMRSLRQVKGELPMSRVQRPNQRQRRKAVRRAIANGFRA
jgi:hypothetical protein